MRQVLRSRFLYAVKFFGRARLLYAKKWKRRELGAASAAIKSEQPRMTRITRMKKPRITRIRADEMLSLKAKKGKASRKGAKRQRKKAQR